MSAVTRVDAEGFKFCDLEFPRGVEEDVLLIEGMIMANGERLYSVFDGPWHARQKDADNRCIGSIGHEFLTLEHRQIAAHNTERLQCKG